MKQDTITAIETAVEDSATKSMRVHDIVVMINKSGADNVCGNDVMSATYGEGFVMDMSACTLRKIVPALEEPLEGEI